MENPVLDTLEPEVAAETAVTEAPETEAPEAEAPETEASEAEATETEAPEAEKTPEEKAEAARLLMEKIKKWMILATAGLLVAVLLGGVWTLLRYTMVNGTLYPKNKAVLDLTDRDISQETLDALAAKIPDTKIIWNIPFQGRSFPSDSKELTVTTLTDADVAQMDYFTDLTQVDATGCRDYPQLLALQQRHPNCTVRYLVRLGSQDFPQDATSVTVPDLTADQAPLLAYLPRLTRVDATGCREFATLVAMQQALPGCEFRYTVPVGGTEYPNDTTQITAAGATDQEVRDALAGLPALESIHLTDPLAGGQVLTELRTQYPQVSIRWELTVGDVTLADDVLEADLSARPLSSVEEGKALAAYFPDAEKVIFESGDVPYEDMAAFREEMRDSYKVVWTVIMGTGKRGQIPVRTDETTFMPYKHGIIYFLDEDMYNLRYCEDMICIDVGHFTFKSIEFVQFMPHLKYLVLTLTDVRDLTPISSCKELVFLELGHTGIRDYSPLLGCTALEDLNLGQTYGDPEPLKQMTWLKNLWWVRRSMSVMQELEPYLTNTNMVFRPNSKDTTSFGWRQLPNYYAMRDMLEMPYMR